MMNAVANTNDVRMTVREVAEALGCSHDAITKHAKELYPNLMRNGVATYLNEEQVTAIKQKMRPTTKVVGAMTDLEAGMMAARVIEHYQARYEREQKARVEAERNVARLESKAEADRPKVEFFDQVTDSGDAIQMRDVAAVLNLPGWGRNNIFALLRDRKVLDRNNVPYREYQDRGYFRVIEQKWTDSMGETRISLKTLAYQRGVDFIRRLISEMGAKAPYAHGACLN